MVLIIALIDKGKVLGLQSKMNAEVLEEITFIAKLFLLFKVLGICGTAPHFDLKR